MKNYLYKIFGEASFKLPYLKDKNLTFDIPKISSQGDLSTNIAMLLTKELKRNPRIIADEIIASLNIDPLFIRKIEVAGPGFINFFFTPLFTARIIARILEQEDSFGKSDINKGKKANVEFVSANPTGPLTVGHGRNAVYGDTVANMLEWTGYEVDREYYFNNAGRQMRVLGDSVKLRYLELSGEQIDFPSDYYQGEYIKEIAGKLHNEHGEKLQEESSEGIFKQAAESEIFSDIKGTLERLGIVHKIFYNENSLYEEGKIEDVIDQYKKKKFIISAGWGRLAEVF